MRPLRRSGVSKRGSAARFRGHSRKTKARNILAPSRGGIRL